MRVRECGGWGDEGRGGTRRRGVNENKKKRNKTKKIIEDISQAEAGLFRNVNRSRGKQKFMRSTDQHTNKVMQE